MVSTWLYVPNLIGYVRIITGLAAFMYAFDKAQHGTFFALYAFSYLLDAVDGVAARALKQTSRFGAVLDMVTDRFCTAGLLAVLAHLFQEHPLHYVFIWLMILDIVSHWAQMYSQLASGAASHKTLQDEHPLLRFYYTFPYALFTVCLLNETCLLSFFLLKHEDAVESFMATNMPAVRSGLGAVGGLFFSKPLSVPQTLLYLTFPVFALKQLFSILQLHKAATRIVAMDEAAKAEAAKAKAA